jgi:hypothetical protein
VKVGNLMADINRWLMTYSRILPNCIDGDPQN